MRLRLLPGLALLFAAPATSQTGDGRLYGHLPYGEAGPADLVDAPAGFSAGGRCQVHRAMLPHLTRLVAAADAAPELGGSLHAISCFRSIERQRALFCRRAGDRCEGGADRAREVAPPAHSEHATGYAIDFAVRPTVDCPDVEPCFAASVAGRWLLANAPRFGFELSFPAFNRQGVTWEPWHWRWVGVTQEVPGAATARALFARARTDFPAKPAVIGLVIRVASEPPVPEPPPPPAPEPKAKHKRRH